MDWSKYTQTHAHPPASTVVELVAYETKGKVWDVFVHEPVGSVPELDKQRVDEEHILLGSIASPEHFAEIVEKLERTLGPPYARTCYYRELGTKRVVGRISEHLKKHGAFGVAITKTADGFELWMRHKDIALAALAEASNVVPVAVEAIAVVAS